MVLQHRFVLALACTVQASELRVSATGLAAGFCQSLLQTQQKRSKRYDVGYRTSQGTPKSVQTTIRDGFRRRRAKRDAVSMVGKTHAGQGSRQADRHVFGMPRSELSNISWPSTLQQGAVQQSSTFRELEGKVVLQRTMLESGITRGISSIMKAMSLHQAGSPLAYLIFACLLGVLLVLAFSVFLVSHSHSASAEHHSEDEQSVSSQRLTTGAGNCLCPELVPAEGGTGAERIYTLQNPGAQVPGEMVVRKAVGDMVARIRTGVAGGALLVLVAPGGAVLASCEEVKMKDLDPANTSRTHSFLLLIKDRMGRVFAQIFDKGYIEAHLHNGKRVMVVRQAHTGAMTVVNERRQLLATVEPPSEHDKQRLLTLKILPGADLGMILVALLAHSCFERRKVNLPSSVEAPPLLRMAP